MRLLRVDGPLCMTALVAAATVGAGCNTLFGVDELCYDCGGGPGGQGGATTSSSAGGGQGGAGGGSVCTLGEARTCYDGPPATAGVGDCVAGEQLCTGESGWGPCVGQILPATEICGDPDDQDCNGYDCGETVWVKIFGDDQDQEARRVRAQADGSLALIGTYQGSIDLGGGALLAGLVPAGWVARLDAEGEHLASWALVGGSIQGEGVADLLDGPLVVGADFMGSIDVAGQQLTSAGGWDGVVVASDPQGQPLWGVRFGGGQQDNAQDVAVLAGGDVVVAGYLGSNSGDFMGAPLPSHGAYDVVVARLTAANGEVQWAASYGSAGDQFPMDVEAAADLGALVVGGFQNNLDFGGGAHASTGGHDLFVVRLDGAGQEVWSQAWGAANDQRALAVAETETGEWVVVGFTEAAFDVGLTSLTYAGGQDAFVIKLDALGQPLWARSFGGPGNDFASGVAIDPSGAIWLVGRFQDSIDLGGGPLTGPANEAHVFVAKLAPDGAHLHSRAYLTDNLGGAPFGSFADMRSIAVDAAGFASFAGYFRNSVDFGLGSVASAGGADAFVVKLAP